MNEKRTWSLNTNKTLSIRKTAQTSPHSSVILNQEISAGFPSQILVTVSAWMSVLPVLPVFSIWRRSLLRTSCRRLCVKRWGSRTRTLALSAVPTSAGELTTQPRCCFQMNGCLSFLYNASSWRTKGGHSPGHSLGGPRHSIISKPLELSLVVELERVHSLYGWESGY